MKQKKSSETRRKTSPARKSAAAKPRAVRRHELKSYWPYLPTLAIFGLGIFLSSFLHHATHSVLGYATDMSIQSLFDDTNQQRSANGVAGLSLNNQLDQAAQAKANDMAARDYWSHNTPDGQTPWTFITAAGYSYQTAGENLAYGFATAADTLTGWMNSPGHRANILNTSFTEVGFGIIDIANYQNSGPETLVVAMYASPANLPAPAPTTPPVAAPQHSAATPSAPATTTENTNPATTPTAPNNPPPNSDTVTPATSRPSTASKAQQALAPEPKSQRLSRVQLVSNGQAGIFAVSSLTLLICVFFLVRHGIAWHKFLRRGERFVLHHPAVDAAAATALVICLLLSQTTGLIR